MHSKHIVHRNLRLETIYVRSKNEKLALQIGAFDFAYCLKKNHAVTQTFNV